MALTAISDIDVAFTLGLCVGIYVRRMCTFRCL